MTFIFQIWDEIIRNNNILSEFIMK